MDVLSLLMSCAAFAGASYALLKGRENQRDLETDQTDLQEHIKAVEDMVTVESSVTNARLVVLEENEKRFAISRGRRGAKAAKSNGQQPTLSRSTYLGEEPLREKQSAEESGES